ncbi:hypothetical protein [Reyranella soli]|uniref:hypothetical protein n=1 Tax=Reyranella soli TaxID=1230389 RepID=UPI001478ACC9|nr:hypothetical protein [Reyranella soli]
MARHPQISDENNRNHPADNLDVSARYLVYNIFIAMSGMPEASRLLQNLGENEQILARAVERGWVEVIERRRKSGAMARLVALTDEGRRMARKSLH